MTSPRSPPNRRRQRIAIAVVVLVVGLCWWFWPRVDQRFVGTWSVWVHPVFLTPVAAFQLDADGTGSGASIEGGTGSTFHWRVRRDKLLMVIDDGTFLSPFKARLALASPDLVGPYFSSSVIEQGRLESAKNDKLLLRDPYGDPLTLRRLTPQDMELLERHSDGEFNEKRIPGFSLAR